jgi:hypothetical protein
MKILLTMLISLFALTAQAQTTFEHFTADDEWPTFEGPGGQPMPNIIFAGEFYCTGGGEPIVVPDAPPTFQCDGGKGIHIRNTEMISFMGNSQPPDPRLEGLVWFDLAANWDSDYTGPVIGNWRIEPFAYMEDPTTYWEGTYVGTRELVPDSSLPPGVQKWVTTLKLVGYGMGSLDGQQVRATEAVTTYGTALDPLPVPWELLPGWLQGMIGGTGPEGLAEITIITE